MAKQQFCCATSQTVYSRQSSLPGRHCPTLWNSLTDDIVLADSLSTFRCQLKNYLFQQFYRDVVL